MKLLILDENYPHLDNLIGNVFVHVRAKEYALHHEVKVFSFFHQPRTNVYEGIEMEMFDSVETLYKAVKNYNPDKIIIHFYQSWMLEHIIKKVQVPVLIWVHGYEALGWYRRLFNFTLYSRVLFRYIKRNTKQQYHFRKLIRFANAGTQVIFIFVSDWMRKVTETDTLKSIKTKYIIPNPIDTHLFQYREKEVEMRKKILLLRSFGTRKYANDISAKAIELLATRPFFKELQFTIIGKGSLYKKITAPLRRFSNIDFHEKVVRQMFIPELHAQYGIFLCPTRQDAQGVSMCEAMSSGLVPVTSANTAIPEFVTNNKTGFVTNGAQEVADAIEQLYQQPSLFQEMSRAAAMSMEKKCGLEAVVKMELSIIEK